MARKIALTDDITGEPDAFERIFVVGGTEYSIDLTDENYAAMLNAVRPWRDAAKIRKHRQNRAPVLDPTDRPKIREWAEKNGYKLAPRGRFPNHVVREYYEDQFHSEYARVLNG